MEATKLRRGPFGYTSRSVRLVLAGRDVLLAQASERAGAAEAQVLDLRSEAETLKTQLAEQAEQLRTLGAEAAELRSDRDAARLEFEGAVAEAARLQLELTAARRQLETVQNDRESIQLGSEAARGGPDPRDEPHRAAQEGSGEIAFIREELSSARRHFLIQSQQIESAEARIEVLETQVRSLRPELEAGLSAAVADLEAARAAVDEVASRPARDPIVTAEGTAVVPETAGWATSRVNGAGTHAADQLREAAAGIGDRVDEAVAPLTDAIDELNVRLAAFAELAAPPGEETPEPAAERSLNLVELEERDVAPGRPDPHGPVAEGIVPPAPPPVDQTHAMGAERHSG
jgi:outer membrane murein-binding lipoprotein Lpp